MDLKARLARLDQLTRKPASEPDAATAPSVAEPAGDRANPRDELGLTVCATPDGNAWVRTQVGTAPAVPSLPLPDIGGVFPAGRPADLRPQEMLFLDTETTGLAGGTGSLAFLVGLAWWRDDGAFAIEQLFLPGPGCEAPLLHVLHAAAARFRVVVTYNGGSFDLPLLRTRALLARRGDGLADLVSWDLLTAVRRFWGPRLPDCRQQTAETALCGLARAAGDIDGALIPHAYFQYLREDAPGLLPTVLRHNRRDLRGMGHILREVMDAAAHLAPVPRPQELWSGTWQDAWARGKVCERRHEPATAGAWIGRACDDAGIGVMPPADLALPLRFYLDAVRILKRVGDWVRIARAIEAALVRYPDERRLLREAAILYEHRLGDLARALAHAESLGDARRVARLRARLH